MMKYQPVEMQVKAYNAMTKHEETCRKALEPVIAEFIGKKVVKRDGQFTARFREAIDKTLPAKKRYDYYPECFLCPANMSETMSSSILLNLRAWHDCLSGVGCFYVKRELYLGRINWLGELQPYTSDAPKREHYTVAEVQKARAKRDKLEAQLREVQSYLSPLSH